MNGHDERINLHPAHCWDCPACGHHNFEDCVRAELTPDQQAELSRLMGNDDEGEEWKRGGAEPEFIPGAEMVTAPEQVKCGKCGAEYDVELPEGPTLEDLG